MNIFELIVLLISLVCFFYVIIFVFIPGLRDIKIRKGVNNSAKFKVCYCYLLETSREEALELLSLSDPDDITQYKLNREQLTLKISQKYVSYKYKLSFATVDSKTYLHLEQIDYTGGRSNIPYSINYFIIKKLNAKPIDYNYFQSLMVK